MRSLRAPASGVASESQKEMQKGPGAGGTAANPKPRPLTDEERKALEEFVGKSVDWERVKLDEGFWGEGFDVDGQVRSNYEINVKSGYSGWKLKERLSLLVHEGVHIWQRQHGLLDNFRGSWLHIRAWLTGSNPYVVGPSFRGSFWDLNFEQQANVVRDYFVLAREPSLGLRTGLDPGRIRELYGEFRRVAGR